MHICSTAPTQLWKMYIRAFPFARRPDPHALLPQHTARQRRCNTAIDPHSDVAGIGFNGEEVNDPVAVDVGPAVLGAEEAFGNFYLRGVGGGEGLEA